MDSVVFRLEMQHDLEGRETFQQIGGVRLVCASDPRLGIMGGHMTYGY